MFKKKKKKGLEKCEFLPLSLKESVEEDACFRPLVILLLSLVNSLI